MTTEQALGGAVGGMVVLALVLAALVWRILHPPPGVLSAPELTYLQGELSRSREELYAALIRERGQAATDRAELQRQLDGVRQELRDASTLCNDLQVAHNVLKAKYNALLARQIALEESLRAMPGGAEALRNAPAASRADA